MMELILQQREKRKQKRVIFLYPTKQLEPINPRKNIPTQTCVDNKEDDDEDDSKVELFLKPGKHEKFEFL